ncbi:ribose-phosphate pyrophosphokinase [Archaeoglobales archaeon]|nr:MAG: ribose-phosphate pyrophosphokinase [Archaeoglobales archaeon]
MKPLILAGTQGILAVKVAKQTGYPLGYVQIEKLPDGEKYVRLSSDVNGRNVFLFNSFAKNPDEMIIESVFLIETIKEYGANSINCIFPYFPYSRQDRRFIEGEALSLKVVSKLFRNLEIDRMYVFDFHLHRIDDLTKFFRFEVVNLTAMKKLANYSQRFSDDLIVVAPDEEAIQWARMFAEEIDAEYIYFKKIRVDAENVIISSPPPDVKGRDVIIVDDMISTGGTVIQALRVLREGGCNRCFVACTHAILAKDALKRMLEAGVEDMVASDTVLSPISHVTVSDIISNRLKKDFGKY